MSAPSVPSTTLLSAWEDTVRAAPEARALIDAGTARTFSRAELDRNASAWCAARGAGLAGQSVVFAEPNGLEWLRVMLGLLKAGAVIVPMDPGEPLAAQRTTAAAIRAGWWWSEGKIQLIEPTRPARDGRRVVKLTSGSTGVPRAIAFTDTQMLADGRQVCASMGIGPADVNLALIPFGHSYGLGNVVVPLILKGTAIVAGMAAMPHAIAESVARWQPTVFPAVPALLRALAIADVAPESLRSLRTIISAGAPLDPEVARAFHARFGRPIHSFYGSSETGGITYDRSGDASLSGRSVGTPLDGVRIAFGSGGRFSVESAAVYTIGNRNRNGHGFGRHRPADVAEMNAHGEVVLRGRAGRFVKIAGRRLNLAEVEQALKRLPGVREALVAPHPERSDALAAVVATEQTPGNLRAALRERVAGWKIPKKFVVLAAFPVTARGKVDTRQLRAMLGG